MFGVMKRWLKWGAVGIAVGSLFPTGYLCLYHLGYVQWFPDWGMYLWPTSFFLMATDGQEDNQRLVALVTAISIFSNAVIWFVAGIGASVVFRRSGGHDMTLP